MTQLSAIRRTAKHKSVSLIMTTASCPRRPCSGYRFTPVEYQLRARKHSDGSSTTPHYRTPWNGSV